MNYFQNKPKAILVLENGMCFTGSAAGTPGLSCGELIFNSSMTGYQEILSDPSYAGQLITFTSPHIGNVGVNNQDNESSRIWAAGFIVREFSTFYSNCRAEESLASYIKRNNIVGICNIDTRHLVRVIRSYGCMRACIMSHTVDYKKALNLAQENNHKENLHFLQQVTSHPDYESKIKEFYSYHLVVYDFGIKRNILRILEEYKCKISLVKRDTSAEEVLKYKPDGIILSNGPGDPVNCTTAIKAVQDFLSLNIPLLGICLGHQILALACKAKTYKMKFGHHGVNHPIFNLETKKVFITSQNHNFSVALDTLPPELIVTHLSLFDNSLQGIKHTFKPALGFQGHPEAHPGPDEMKSLFRDFFECIETAKQKNIFLQ